MANSETVIGETISISGEFKSKENVSIRGKISGVIEAEADLTVEENGTVQADITTQSIDVRGSLVGNISAADRLELHPSGNVEGDIRAPRVILADGCKYKGKIEVVDG